MELTVQDGASLWATPGVAPEATDSRPNPATMDKAQPPPSSSHVWSGQMAALQPPGFLGSKRQLQVELDSIAAAVRMFFYTSPDQVMRECAAYTARITEMCVLLHRVESTDRQFTRVRTMQCQKWIEELDRQFKTASRMIEVMRQDLEMSR